MIMSLRRKTGCLIIVLILMSGGTGFMLGLIVSKAVQKKKETPAFWKQAAMKHLEKLHPDEAQRQQFEAVTDQAVAELSTLREEGIRNVWSIVDQAAADIQKGLKPEQKETFEKIRPKPPANLDK